MLGRLAEYLQLHRNIVFVLVGVWLALFLGSRCVIHAVAS